MVAQKIIAAEIIDHPYHREYHHNYQPDIYSDAPLAPGSKTRLVFIGGCPAIFQPPVFPPATPKKKKKKKKIPQKPKTPQPPPPPPNQTTSLTTPTKTPPPPP